MRRIEAILALPRKAKRSGRAASAWLLFVVACAAVESTCPKQLLQLVGVKRLSDGQHPTIATACAAGVRIWPRRDRQRRDHERGFGSRSDGVLQRKHSQGRSQTERDGKRNPGTARRNNNSTVRVKSRAMFDGRHQRLPVLGESRRSCGRGAAVFRYGLPLCSPRACATMPRSIFPLFSIATGVSLIFPLTQVLLK